MERRVDEKWEEGNAFGVRDRQRPFYGIQAELVG